MASSYTSSLAIQLPADGEQTGLWGQTVNTNMNLVEEAVSGRASVTVTGNVTLSMSNGVACDARNMILELTGSSGAARTVTVPTIEKVWIVYNNTTGGYDHTVKTSAGTGVVVPNGKKMILYGDGTNVVEAVSAITGLVRVSGDTMTGALLAVLGSNSAPGIGFSGDANTGLYSPGADQVGLTAGGTAVLTATTTTATVPVALAVTGTTTLTGALTANGNSTLGDTAGDTLTVNATPTFAAATTFSSTTSHVGTATFTGAIVANGNVTLGDTSGDVLTVNATTTFNSAVTFAGVPTFTGNVVIGDASGDTLTVVSTATFQNGVTIGSDSSDTLTVNSTPTFAAATAFSSTISVAGAASFNGAVALGNATGDAITVTGNATVGSTTTLTKQSAGSFISHGSSSHTSGVITVSTSTPSGGSNGDIWFQVT